MSILEAKHLATQGEFVEAIKLMQGTIAALEPMTDPQILYMIYTAFIEYFEQTQNHKEALHYAKLLMALERDVTI